jgi:hypothetical protein
VFAKGVVIWLTEFVLEFFSIELISN